MSLHAGQVKKVIVRTNNYSKNDSGKGFFNLLFVDVIRSVQERLTDKRVHLMSEIISSMRVIKMYCWERPFALRARKFRRWIENTTTPFQKELAIL